MERRHNVIIGLLVATVAGLIAWRLSAARQRADRAETRATEVSDEGRFHATSEGRAMIESARFAVEVDPAEALAILSKVIDTGNNNDDTAEIRMIAADAASRGYAHRLAGKTRVHGMSVSNDGFLLAVAGDDRKIHVWTLSGERTEQSVLVGHERAVLDVVWVGERQLISIDAGGEVRRWNLRDSSTSNFVLRAAAGTYRSGMLSPGGDRAVMFVGGDADLLQFGAADRSLRDCAHAAWSPDGSLAYTDKTTVHVLTATGIETKLPAPAGLTALAVHHDVFAGFADGSVRTLGTDRIERRHAGPVTQLAIDDDGMVISASSDLDDGEGDRMVMAIRDRQPFRLRGHAGAIDALTVRGKTIVSAGGDGELRAWVLPPQAGRLQWKGDGKLSHAAIAADGSSIAVARSGPAIEIVSLPKGGQQALALDRGTDLTASRIEIGPNGEKIERPLTVPKASIRRFVASADGRRIATLDDSWTVIAWDPDGGRAIGTGYLDVAQSSGGEQIAAIGRDNLIRVWRRGSRGTNVLNKEPTDAMAIDPAGNIALAYTSGGFGRIDTAGVFKDAATSDRKTRVHALAFTGKYAIAGAEDGTVYALDTQAGTLTTLFSHDAPIRSIATGPRGITATADATGTFYTFDAAHILDPVASQPHRGHAGPINTIMLADEIVTAGDDRTVRAWSPGGSRIVARHGARVIAAAATPNSIVSIDELGGILETPDPLPRDRDGLRVWLGNR